MEVDNSMENNMHPNVKIIGNDYHIQWEPKSQKKVEPLNNEMGRSSTQCPKRQKKRKEKVITITENNVHPNVKIVGDYYHIECDPKSSNDSMKIDKELRKYSMDQRRLQVKLTRLPMHLFKNGKMTTKLSVTDIEELEALGLHTEINIKLDPEERLKEEPPDFTTDYDNVVDHDSVCTSVLNIKLETEEELIKTEEKLKKIVDKLNETEEMWHTTEELNKTENKLNQTEKLNKTEYKLDETEEMWNETVDKLNETEEIFNETEEELSETEEILNETENFKEQPLDYSGSDDDVDDDDDTSPFYETILIATSEAHDSPETDVEDTDLTRTAKDIKTDDDNLPNIKKEIKPTCRFDDDHVNTDMCDENTDVPPKEPRNELLDGVRSSEGGGASLKMTYASVAQIFTTSNQI
ncbi:hypothetical protein O0L34_g13027 [Tuta absoluta]|nr:hypothetical protein O0L34_g13027 [Tuta absoluta]